MDHTDIKEQYLNYIAATLVSGKVHPSGHDHSSDIIMLLGNWAYYGNSTPSSIHTVTALTRKKLDSLDTKLDSTQQMSKFRRFRMFLELTFVTQPRAKTAERYQNFAVRQTILQDAITMSLFLCQVHLINDADEQLATEIDRTVRLSLALSCDYPLGTEYNPVLGLVPMYKGMVLFKLDASRKAALVLILQLGSSKLLPTQQGSGLLIGQFQSC